MTRVRNPKGTFASSEYDESRPCQRCGEPLDESNSSSSRRKARSYTCNPCIRKRQKEYYAANPEALERRKELRRIRKTATKEKVREMDRKTYLVRVYGLMPEEHDAMLKAQNYRCAVCEGTDTAPYNYFCVDHCHSTGVIRGLLCFSCNIMLGKAKDNPTTLRRGAAYLEAADPLKETFGETGGTG